MKRTKRMMLATLAATLLVTMTMMTQAFAATTTSTCGAAKTTNSTNSATLSDLTSKLETLKSIGSTTCATNGINVNEQLNALIQKLSAACKANVSTAKPTTTATAAPSATVKPTATATAKPTATATAKPTATATAKPTATATSNTSSGSMSAQEQKMINLVNQARADAGLSALTYDSTLRTPAIKHSQDMSTNNFFSHTSPTYGSFSTRLKASGVKYTSAGENLAMYGSVEAAHEGLMNSSGHRANILNANYTRVGIGIVYNQSRGVYYITQWFAK